MGRILAIDYGTKRIGLAISDPRAVIATPLSSLSSEKTMEGSAASLIKAMSAYSPLEKIVLGLPLHMDGKESPMSHEVRKFAAILEKTFSIPVLLWDERLTSMQAEKALKSRDVSRKKRVECTDALAATILLQTYLDSL